MSSVRALRASLIVLSLWLPGVDCLTDKASHLVASSPAPNATGVLPSAWLELEFDIDVDAALEASLSIGCDGAGTVPFTSHRVGVRGLVVNPEPRLPAGTRCALRWYVGAVIDGFAFETALGEPAAEVLYDPEDPARTAPYPDDMLLVEDASRATGFRHAMALPDRPMDVRNLFRALLNDANQLDGFSPIGPWVVGLDRPADAASLPATAAESLEPLASLLMVDVDPASPRFGERIPFIVQARDDLTLPSAAPAQPGRTLIVFPSIPLEPMGRYALVVTTRVRSSLGTPFAPSPFFADVLAPPEPDESAGTTRARALLADTLDALETVADPPIPREDIALVLQATVRSLDDIPNDVLAIKRSLLAGPPPSFQVDQIRGDSHPAVAAIVEGTWFPPKWRQGANLLRDPETGEPVRNGVDEVGFVLALPEAARTGPVPLVMYQHGNPGSAEGEVPNTAREFLAEAGYAVIGFTDVLNREVAPGGSSEDRITTQALNVFFGLAVAQQLPDHWMQTRADQLAMVRMIDSFDTLDLLPVGSPDGIPEIDLDEPLLYMGISEGGNNLQGFAPYVPEVRAGALFVGGARLAEVLVFQSADLFLDVLPDFLPNFTPVEIWTGVALFQVDFDRQDNHVHARFLYREPVPVPLVCPTAEVCAAPGYCDTPGNCSVEKPSILILEGLEDTLVPNNATESAAFQMGPMPHLGPVQRPIPFLEVVHEGSVRANIDARTTAALFQYVPRGVPGIPNTPGCSSSFEGHYCAQGAPEALGQTLIFFGTALDPTRAAPTIVDPLPLFGPGQPLFPLPSPLP